MLPQIILIALMAMGLGMHIVKHGEERKYTEYNWIAFLLSRIIWIALLWWGGFFNVFVR